jgi:glycosyltransferase involved in cell wall biosynthesis
MGKTVWIMNHYASHMLFDKGGRHYWFAKYLNRAGYQPVVFCANIQNSKTNEKYIETEDLWAVKDAEEIHTPFVYVRARKYKGNGKQRILNMIDFYRNVKKTAVEYAEKNGKPDIILASSVHPLTMVAGIQLAKKFGVKCICEVRDLWPEAIVAYSKRITKNSLPAKIMYAGEKWIYKKAAAVIFTQEGGPDYVCEHGWDKKHGGPIDNDKLFHINNGVDLEAFDENLVNFPYADEDLDNPDLFKVVYCGAIRRINNLGIILDSAKLITNPKVKFVIFGSGDELETLKNRVVDEGITNVVFKGRVNKQYIPSIDSKADLNVVHWEMNPLLRVGESYNKSFEYFAAGKPVFYTVRPGYSIVEKYGCGRLTEGFAPKDIAAGIQAMAEMSDTEKSEMAKNARKTAEVYDFKNLTKKLIEIIETR